MMIMKLFQKLFVGTVKIAGKHITKSFLYLGGTVLATYLTTFMLEYEKNVSTFNSIVIVGLILTVISVLSVYKAK